MEGAPKLKQQSAAERESNIENFADWRELRDRAPEKAAHLIKGIDGYESMKATEKIVALQDLKDNLAVENKNRFVDRVLASEIARMMDVSDREREEQGMPLRSPYEKLQTPQESVEMTDFPAQPPSGYQERNGYPTRFGDGVKVDEVAEVAPGVLRQAS